jgi:putative transcriptional regulator
MHCLQGHFLIAAPHQPDPNFAETVILVVEHAERGAFGVILNCPRERQSDSSSPQRASKHPGPEHAKWYFGGPVTGPLMAVHREESLAEIEVLPGVFFSGKEENVLTLMRESRQPYKIFTGYAGWGPGQLELEIERGVWRVLPADAGSLFSESRLLWEQLSRQAFERHLHLVFNLKHIPTSPLLN